MRRRVGAGEICGRTRQPRVALFRFRRPTFPLEKSAISYHLPVARHHTVMWTCQCDNPAFNEIRAVDTCGFRLGNYIIMRLKPRKEEHDYSSIHRRFFFQCEDRNSLANFFLHPLSLFFSLVEREASFRNERGCTCRVYAGETRRAR